MTPTTRKAVRTAPPLEPTDDVMRHALGVNADMSVNIPADATLTQVEGTLKIAIQGHERLSEAAERLKPIIGRIMLTIQERKLFRPAWKNFTAFVQERVVKDMGFGRSNAFEALRIARAFPHLSTEQYETYRAKRLLLASQITTDQSSDWQAVLDKFRGMTVEDAKRYVIEVKLDRNSGRPRPAVIAIRCTQETALAWKAIQESLPDTPVGDVLQLLIDAYGNVVKPRGRKSGAVQSAA